MKTSCWLCGTPTIMPFGNVTQNPLCRSCFFKEQQTEQWRNAQALDNQELSEVDWDSALYELLKEGR